MFGKLLKKIIPIAIAGAGLYTGTSILGGMGGSKLFASSTLTNKFKEKALGEIMKKGMKNVFGTPSEPVDTSDYNVDFDEYLMQITSGSKTGTGSSSGNFGQLQSADPEAIAFAWQRRLNSYLKSGDIV
jgi:hypothetical protein